MLRIQSQLSLSSFHHEALVTLSPLQKKIIGIALIAFIALTTCYYLYTRCFRNQITQQTPGTVDNNTKQSVKEIDSAHKVLQSPSEPLKSPEEKQKVDQNSIPSLIESKGLSGVEIVEMTPSQALKNTLAEQIRGLLCKSQHLFEKDSPALIITIYIDEKGELHGINPSSFKPHTKDLVWLKAKTKNNSSKLFGFNLRIWKDKPSEPDPIFLFYSTQNKTLPKAIFTLPDPIQKLAKEAVNDLNRLATQSFQIVEQARKEDKLRRRCNWKDVFLQEGTLKLPPNTGIKKTIKERLENNRKDALKQQSKENSSWFKLAKSVQSEVIISGKAVPIVHHLAQVGAFQVGSASCIGPRPAMEDAELMKEETVVLNHKDHALSMFAICDGHGGSSASTFVKGNLPVHLKRTLEKNCQKELSEETIFPSLQECFKNLDADYYGEGGTTVNLASIIDRTIHIANVGDSRTVGVKMDGTAIQFSEDAKPDDPTYKRKIEEAGGTVENNRVNNQLAVARAIGDKTIMGKDGKRCVLPDPKITSYALDEFEYLVIACDGFFDICSSDKLGNAILQLHRKGKNPMEMAQMLVFSVLDKKLNDNVLVGPSQDNVSVMVIKLK